MSQHRHEIISEYLNPAIAQSPDLIDEHGLSLLHNVIQHIDQDDCIGPLRQLWEKGVDMSARDGTDVQYQPIHRAVYLSNKKAVQFLVKECHVPITETARGNTPLHLAILAESPDIEIVKTLLQPQEQPVWHEHKRLEIRKCLARKEIEKLLDKKKIPYKRR
jgi:hypothetical protein